MSQRIATEAEERAIDEAKAILLNVNLSMTGLKDGNGAVVPSKGF